LGANTALRDSALLGKLLAESNGSVDGVTAKYEAEMRLYASEAVATSYGMAKQQLGLSIKEVLKRRGRHCNNVLRHTM
jgi:2-polyprenyl-6-methoxyphenol hydroxylase-like FAD-dependent oxidoreductase